MSALIQSSKDFEKPIIGVVPLIDKQRESYWMLPGYMEGIEEAGGIPVMLPLTYDSRDILRLTQTCSGFLFTGGQDVTPEIYGEKTMPECGENSKERDQMEAFLLKSALDEDKPVLGICRGIQFINAALGGTLYQDLPTQHHSDVVHCQKPPYDAPSHRVTIVQDTLLFELVNQESIQVNSYHHQGIKKLADSLTAMAVSPDGLVEAVYMPDKSFVWAVQWHPEFSYKVDENSRKIFRVFVKAALPKNIR